MWVCFPLCLELRSPLHIGFLPNAAGTVLAPTRFYVPGKNLWAAVTESLATRIFERPRPQDFAAIGSRLKESLAFSYFYLSDGQRIFAPSYEQGELKWAELSDPEFRASFADSRLSTQIGSSGSTKEPPQNKFYFSLAAIE